ncbi:MAG: diaminopimelate decarboxylase, partial [Proteobacteria bacterium]|nr:diaminopimelate decarboxylase [Pseudomonadota bacterium]
MQKPLDHARLRTLAAEFGTPLWLYDAAIIRERIAALKAFDHIRFAQKACSNIHILRLMRAQGVLVDAVSPGEITRALAAGYSSKGGQSEIVFTADLATEDTLALVVAEEIPMNAGS